MKDRLSERFEEFLERKAEQGDFRSEGAFTVRQDVALDKLAEYSLEDKEDWVLKVVQAAVARRAQVLHFKFRRETVEVEFSFPHEFRLSEIGETLLDITKEPTDFARELNVALRTLLPFRALSLATSAGKRLHWDGERLGEGKLIQKFPECSLQLVIQRNRDSLDFLTGTLKRAYESLVLGRLLKNRAVYAPLKLVVDGQVISPQTVKISKRGLSPHGEYSRLLLRANLCEDGQWDDIACPIVPAPHDKWSDRLESDEPFLSALGRVRSSCLLELYCGYNEFEQNVQSHDYRDRLVRTRVAQNIDLKFTRLGVVCATRQLKKFALGGQLVMNGDELESDLMGLRLSVNNEAWAQAQDRLKRAYPLLKRLSEKVRAHRPQVELPAVASGVAKTLGFGAVGAKAILMMLPITLPVLALGAGMGAGAGVLLGTLNVKEDSREQVAQMASWVEVFAAGYEPV